MIMFSETKISVNIINGKTEKGGYVTVEAEWRIHR